MGKGFTVATGEIGLPVQPFAVGVIVYVTVPFEEAVAVSCWAILLPLPEAPPLALT